MKLNCVYVRGGGSLAYEVNYKNNKHKFRATYERDGAYIATHPVHLLW